jgi:hypothetical protein
MTWVLILWCGAILAWAIAGGASAAHQCAQQTGDQFLSANAAQQACDAGTGIGLAVILGIGFFGFVFLSMIWFMTKPRGRDCPTCGELVRRGDTICKDCGYDFVTRTRMALDH